ncbi:MAG: hypothetical protein HWN68_19065 [Desulfobacterales bacterium]|nr:hypothetical protein [Desulfobacterales bacterium]
MIKKFRDLLALIILVAVIPGLWIATGRGYLTLPGEVIGATIMAWGLLLQFYFRKRPMEEKTGESSK